MPKIRLDLLLVERGLADSRAKAQALIMAGQVRVAGQTMLKPATAIPTDAVLTVDPGPRFVSRGGEKLDAALEAFALDVTGLTCADVGSSTGGFTDCLLQRGAARVYAIDVGKGILHWKLRNDPRVVVTDARVSLRVWTARGDGVIRDPQIHRQVLTDVLSYAQQESYGIRGLVKSPLLGPKGNAEFLVWLDMSSAEKESAEISSMIENVVTASK